MAKSKIILTVAGVLFFFSLYVPQPVWPLYIKEQGFSVGLVGLLLSLYSAALVVSRIPIGILADSLVGKRRFLMSVGFSAIALGSILPPLAAGVWGTVLSRVVLGLGAGFYVAFTIIFASFFPGRSLKHSMALATTFFGLGQILATPLGGFLAQVGDGTAPFWVGAGAALLGALLASQIQEPEIAPTRGRLLPGGFRLYLASALMMIVCFALFATTYNLTQILADGLGATKADQGLLLSSYLGAFTVVALLIASPLSDRVGSPATVLLGMGFLALGIGLAPMSTLAFLYVSEVLTGIGLGLTFGLLMAMSVDNVPEGQRFSAMGIFQFVYAIGMFAGPAVASQIAESASMAAAFYASVGVIAAGAAVLLLCLQLRRL